MMAEQTTILIQAFGNPGRGDDGLGNACAELCNIRLPRFPNMSITVESSYQLSVEDAYTMSEFDIVIFVDATKEEIDGCSFTRVEPAAQSPFTTHAMLPSGVLHLCHDLYGEFPETYLLQIRGYSWEMVEKLSVHAEENLLKAFHMLRSRLEEWAEVRSREEQER